MKTLFYITFVMLISSCALKKENTGNVEFRSNPEKQKIDVYINQSYFTSFIYPDDMEKPTLYPIMTASGKPITRGFPLDPRPFERTDHPHHVGLWFNFGDVNGLDFWNNSFAIKQEDKHKYGSIKFKEVLAENSKTGELKVSADWLGNDGNVLLNEETTYLFSGVEDLRTIERITRLKAVQSVTFNENKEGLIGLRLDRAFEEPSKKPEKFLDSNGNVTEVPLLNNEGVNGVYRNAEGVHGGDVWGKRSGWVALHALKDGEDVTIVIIDNPRNPNYPAWSHARGYGLFATNNLGGRAFDANAEPVELRLDQGEDVIFRHKVVIGGDLTDEEINEIAQRFN